MKKNMLTVVIMATSLINLILTAVMLFSIMPAMDKSTALVDKVAEAIDLEVDAKDKEEAAYTVADLVPYDIKFDAEAKINLKPSADGKNHFGILSGITVSFNSKAEDFEDVQTSVTTADVYITDIVKDVIASHSYDDLDAAKVKEESLKRIQEKYDSKAIVEISLTGFMSA